METITQHAKQRLRERCNVDARKLEALMQQRHLKWPKEDCHVSGYGTFVIQDGRLITILDEDMCYCRRSK